VPTETLTTNERVAPEAVPEIVRGREDEALRKLALRHLERVRKFKLSLAVYVLSLLVLTPVWIVTQYEQADGWPEHLSTRSRYAGDWDPWIIWVALIGAFVVAIFAVRAYFERASTEDEIEREIERLKTTR
jgi:NADH:ubiquinone oxidoreductase subunit 5 (subunit L)/multisubunit Na+/H+ antiporter MnhA subunit